jgi:hypothetical protein
MIATWQLQQQQQQQEQVQQDVHATFAHTHSISQHSRASTINPAAGSGLVSCPAYERGGGGGGGGTDTASIHAHL